MARKRKVDTREFSITQIVEVPIKVTIPTVCPKCKADFTEPDSLTECQWGAGQQSCYLPVDAPKSDDDPCLADYGESEDIFDGSIIVGYQCGACGWKLASTEPTRTITPEIMRGLKFATLNVTPDDVGTDPDLVRAVDMATAFVADLQVPRG